MKNIHVLPTDKPSRLLVRNDKPFVLMLKEHSPFATNKTHTNQNIDITSDEEIKEGDWFYNIISLKPEPFKACENGDGYVNCSKYSHYRIDCKKIILTDNKDLIKDGVQAIDDEFLEWFVKNPNCESVETKLIEQIPNGITFGMFGNDEPPTEIVYKIIIPQEEPKQETLEEVDEYKKNLYFKKQVMNPYPVEEYSYTAYEKGFIEGYEESGKWQAERMYSEEEVLEILNKRVFDLKHKKDIKTTKEWFEQFKKK